jgi:hypothetical protein
MASGVDTRGSAALIRKLADLQGIATSREYAHTRQRIGGAIERGYHQQVLAGVNAVGTSFPALKTTRKGKYAGASGAPTVPFDSRSTMYRGFKAEWTRSGNDWVLTMRVDGPEWVQYHLTGTPRMAKRNAMGISRKTHAEIDRFIFEFLDQYTRPR